jgi:hypothetical protein
LSSKVDSDVCCALCLSVLEIFKKASKVKFWKILSLGGRGFQNIFSLYNFSNKDAFDVCSALCVSALEIFKKAFKVKFLKIFSLGEGGFQNIFP